MSMLRGSSERITCFNCQHRERSEWGVLTEKELQGLDSGKICREYFPGEAIFLEGDPCLGVYCVERGLVGVRKTDAEGNSVLVRIANSGDTLGYRPFLAGDVHRGTAEALKPTIICAISGSTVRRLLAENPSLGLQFLERTAKALGDAEEKYFQNVTLPVRARLAHLLVVLKDRYGTVAEDGSLTMELPMSRQDLAALIGTRPETMSRAVRQFEEDGIAQFKGRKVHIRDTRDLLAEL